MYKYYLNYRRLINITGKDSEIFLQNILSNDINMLDKENIQYSLLLTPKGKMLFDFFIFKISEKYYLDYHQNYINDIKIKLMLYKLHSDVNIMDCKAHVFITTEDFNEFSYIDPRNKNLGMRCYDFDMKQNNFNDIAKYNEIRIKYLIPEFGVDFFPEEFYPLDLGLDNLNAISFNKGCYIGQEVTARMYHRGKRRKKLEMINLNNYQINDKEVIKDNKKIGKILKIYNDHALALIKSE
ncbi:YgfZ/GcvT domain-containing protein [Rickettsiales endosymbiont of Trichoplax sp. H2]|uniref:CAF17-like 4Fe-4S cluster assembly/insertion protein YgfZ n=1 Tax=Rickettsiales endosymbiont of Trichoplax sp. H2 TaxID=2021221 RepID=UPI0012B29D2A|nr:folate-binding protein YgfZ [Rickettsiales endosymbiont of Trichoplax sp. H2]MSO13305.1 putative transferase CAF17-like protein, mitochondrial [Rickettsiales endosymbiont of Trichoplax sp. H2]